MMISITTSLAIREIAFGSWLYGVARIQQDCYLFHWLFLAKVIVRAREMLFKTHPQPPRVPPRWLNGLLYGITRCELHWLRGLNVPLGSSYLAVVEPAHRILETTTTAVLDVPLSAIPIPISREANCPIGKGHQ